jgi:iron complex outermembrane recepter protein
MKSHPQYLQDFSKFSALMVRSLLMALSRLIGRRAAVAIALLVVSASVVLAQATGRVAGKVTSSEGGVPLFGATIQLVGTPFGTISKADGSYSIALRPGVYTLRVRQIGFTNVTQSITIASGQTLTRDVRLERSVTNLEQVAVVGTRAAERTVTKSPVPVDVFTSVDLKATGRTETAQMIQALAPSVNFPRSAIADGTDAARPATLRGLGADQVLVLINGKRRHTNALVNVNGTVGRGQAAVDLNSIPANMIDRVEVLRDGAAAQYGSDAIAGVINIVLKTNAPNEATVQSGVTAFGDGRVNVVNGNAGTQFGSGGYLHVGAEARTRGYTDRSFADPRIQYAANDVRESPAGVINHRHGDAQTEDYVGMFTAGLPFGGTAEAYAFGGAARRTATGPGFARLPNGGNTVPVLYPNGFLPLINSTLNDLSGGLGAKGTAFGWKWDLSQTIGRNSHNFLISNTNNASFGPTSPTSFNSGTLIFGQASSNLDLFREFKAGTVPVRVALGAEYRKDQYEIEAGEPQSYLNGGRDRNGNAVTVPAASGAQVFPGFRPSDAKNVTRNNTSFYLDVESDLSKYLLLSGAVRSENYSDFGGQTTAKAAFRLAPVEKFAVRGAFSTGFRAPSLQQNFFTSTATNFIGGVPFDITTFAVGSRPAQLLGAQKLRPETSRNASLGVTFEPIKSLSITADYYDIRIDDRVVLSENFIGDSVRALLGRNGITGIGGGRYFTNAIDTKTNGLDVVANYGFTVHGSGVIRLTAGFNQNKTAVTNIVQSTPVQLLGLGEALFSRVERARIERGQPRNNFLGSVTYDVSKFTFTARTQRFGEVFSAQNTVATPASGPLNRQPPDQLFRAKFITDVSIGVKLFRTTQFTLGADNLFDVYPDQNSDPGDLNAVAPTTANPRGFAGGYSGNSNFNIFRYNGISPFGFNGRFVYARVNYRF